MPLPIVFNIIKYLGWWKMDNEQELGIAIWLSQNTQMSAKQISRLCPSIHEFKAALLKSGTCRFNIEPINPIEEEIFDRDEIENVLRDDEVKRELRSSTKRYVPKILRHYIPGIIVWLYQRYPKLPSKSVAMALGTTTKRVSEVLHSEDIVAINPISVQVFTEAALAQLVKDG